MYLTQVVYDRQILSRHYGQHCEHHVDVPIHSDSLP